MKKLILFLLFTGCSTVQPRYMMEVTTVDPRDKRHFIQLFEMKGNDSLGGGSGLYGKELEKDFYCVYWLDTKENSKEFAASVDCQPCHQNDSCEGNISMTVNDLDGSSILELSKSAYWWHKIRFITVTNY